MAELSGSTEKGYRGIPAHAVPLTRKDFRAMERYAPGVQPPAIAKMLAEARKAEAGSRKAVVKTAIASEAVAASVIDVTGAGIGESRTSVTTKGVE
jgi:hypothetical protein